MKTWIGSATTALFFLGLAAGCGGGGAATSSGTGGPNGNGSAPAAADAETALNDAINAALAGNAAATVTDSHSQATLDGTVTADGIAVSFSHLVLAKKPFSASGSVSFAAGDHTATLAFSDSVVGSYLVDGASSGEVHARIPMESSFVQATASYAMHEAWGGFGGGAWFSGSNGNGGPGNNGACNVSVSDDGNGGVLLDGDCSLCGATISFDMVDINLMNGSITGTITIDDGNGNTAVLTFNGTTVDVNVNGQDLGTFDLSQIFGGP